MPKDDEAIISQFTTAERGGLKYLMPAEIGAALNLSDDERQALATALAGEADAHDPGDDQLREAGFIPVEQIYGALREAVGLSVDAGYLPIMAWLARMAARDEAMRRFPLDAKETRANRKLILKARHYTEMQAQFGEVLEAVTAELARRGRVVE